MKTLGGIKMDKNKNELTITERFYAYRFCIDDAILIDREERTISFFKSNIHGQVYNLKSPEIVTSKQIGQKIAGYKRKIKNHTYNMENSYVIDKFLYHFLMTEEDKQEYFHSFWFKLDGPDFIAKGNEKKEVLTTIINNIYEESCSYPKDEKIEEKERLLEPLRKIIDNVA